VEEERRARRRGLAVELVSRAAATGALGWFAWKALSSLTAHLDVLVLLLAVDHTLNVILVLTARLPKDVDRRALVVLLTAVATLYPPLLDLEAGRVLLPRLVLSLALLAGLLFELLAKLWLGRSFGLVPANRGLVRGGPYRLVRHPMYAGYLVVHAAFVASHASLRNALLYVPVVVLVVARIVLEERVLARDEAWREFATKTRSRLVPFVW